jgi:alcohol dehydrogenase
MRAALYETFGGPITVQQVPDPAPAPDGVVIAVRATGLCRSDWHGWMGHDPDIVLPHVPGHELAGEVAAVGSAVTRWRVGERVTVPFICACGTCRECASGNQQVCERQSQPGFTHWGSFAEYVAIERADANLVRLPDELDMATAASLGCRFATSFRAVVDQGRAAPGEWVAVHGCGGVGLAAIMIAHAVGAQVVAIDIAEEKLALARELGAAATLNAAATSDVAGAVRELTGGGAHLALDALGSAATAFASVACLRRRGRHVQVGLMLAGDRHAPVPLDRVVAYELELRGSHGMQAHRYDAMLELIRSGRLRPDRLVGRTVSLEQAAVELPAMASFPGVGVAVITTF